MLKFINRNDKKNRSRYISISMSSVEGGIELELDQDGAECKEETILLTPMDAACFVNDLRTSGDTYCRILGHGAEGSAIGISQEVDSCGGWHMVGGTSDVLIGAGCIRAVAPRFVVAAMRVAVENMMDTLMYPSTGADQEEFG